MESALVGEARRRSGRRRRRDGVDVGRARCDTGDVAPATAEISRRRRGRRSMRRSDAFQCASSPVSGRPVSSSPRPGAFSRHLRREKPLIEARPHLAPPCRTAPRSRPRKSRAAPLLARAPAAEPRDEILAITSDDDRTPSRRRIYETRSITSTL